MKPVFHHKLLNDYFEDPCLFIRILREKRAILFDIGNINRLKPSDIFKVTDVFVTHTHIDHFIGFDTLLRATLRRDTPLNIYGPPKITACVEGKLRGYVWNLTGEYPSVINVFSYNGRSLSHSVFSAKNKYRKETATSSKSDGTLLKDMMFKVRAIVLDHGTPCLAYALEEEFHINIDKDLLTKKGLVVGPWLTEFKRVLRRNPDYDGMFRIEGKSYRLSELSDIARITRGQKISYLTDIAMSKKNINIAVGFLRDSDILYCESYFLEKDRDRALKRSHLTAKTCGEIAKKAGVKRLVPMHFSPKYRDCPECVIKEAMEEFYG
ncbi:MAG: ribonuclease Z [Nitrospirota bacterium]